MSYPVSCSFTPSASAAASGFNPPPQKKSRKGIGGRPVSNIRQHFITKNVIQKGLKSKIEAVCFYCNKTVSNQPKRLENHLMKCTKFAKIGQSNIKDIDQTLNADPQEMVTSSLVLCEYSSDADDIVALPHSFKPRTQVSVNLYAPKLSIREKQELDIMAAKFWFAADIPFNTAKIELWQEFCNKLRPGYFPPSPNELSGQLLDKVYIEARDKIANTIKGQEVIIVQGGWSNVHNKPTVSHTILCNGSPYYLNSNECTDAEKTSQYCFTKLVDSINAVESDSEIGATVVAIIADNCDTTMDLRSLVKTKLPSKFVYGCSAHMLNLLCKNITPAHVIDKIKQVDTYFRADKLLSLLKKYGGVLPQVPNDISDRTIVETFLRNRSVYIKMFQENSQHLNEKKIESIVNNLLIYKRTQDLMNQMNKITKWINICQKDESSIADALEGWLALHQDHEFHSHKNNIEDLMNRAVTPEFYAANLLHPRYLGNRLSGKDREIAYTYLATTDTTYVRIAMAFSAKDPTLFPAFLLDDDTMRNTKSTHWWCEAQKHANKIIPDGFVKEITKLSKCPASTALVKKYFSTATFLHQTNISNCLDQEKREKLYFCFHTLRCGSGNNQCRTENRTSLDSDGD